MSLVQSSPSLRERQIGHLQKMFHLNKEQNTLDMGSGLDDDELIWKVLILDSRSSAIVSSVLRVNDLLQCGITVHSLINSKRAALPDVPVIYFVEPTPENIAKIISDLENDYYSDFYINFTSSLNRGLLENFAEQVAIMGKSYKIKQVYDQYLDFIVTEPELFSLDLQDTYLTFSNPSTKEETISAIANRIANGLFASILTMGSIPIIRCSRDGPAQFVAEKLDQKLRDHVINTKSHLNALDASTNSERIVLVLVDRNIDLASMFAHSWIYQCMVSDVFNLDRNTITIKSNDDQGNSSVKKYDIDPRDFFWQNNAQLPFPDAVENVEKELEKYKKEAAELTAKTGYSSIKDIDPNDNDTKHIQEAVKALPELTARKNIVDMHMSVLMALLKELESKTLDSFFEIEQSVNDTKVQKEFLDLLRATSKGDNSQDKLRTYIIMVLTTDLSSQFMTECESVLKELNCDTTPLKYIKQVKQIIKMSSMTTLSDSAYTNSNVSSNSANSSALLSGLSSRFYGLAEGKISEGVGSFISGLKKLLPEKKQLPITNIVEAIMSPNLASQESVKVTDDYLYFDPRVTRGVHSKPPKRQPYTESMVFVVGGGNYLEYQNLQEWSANTSVNSAQSKSVIYGSTSISTADEFLKECTSLGQLQ